ncbi:MAG: T9SS type A sorting domain-containing protein [Flavobacteriales bacterium]
MVFSVFPANIWVNIINVLGVNVAKVFIAGQQQMIDVSTLNAGMYFIQSNSDAYMMQTFIKK